MPYPEIGKPTNKESYANPQLAEVRDRLDSHSNNFEIHLMAASQPMLFGFIARRIGGPLLYPSGQAGFTFDYPQDSHLADYIYGAITAFSSMREQGIVAKVTKDTIDAYSKDMREKNVDAAKSLHRSDTVPPPRDLPRDELGTLGLRHEFPELHKIVEEVSGANTGPSRRNIDIELGAFEVASLLNLASTNEPSRVGQIEVLVYD